MIKLKSIFKIGILMILSINAFSQHMPFENGYWMPKAYINDLKTSKNLFDKNIENFQKPITSIFIKNDKIWIRTYRSEFNLSEYKFLNKYKIYLKTVKINLATPVIL